MTTNNHSSQYDIGMVGLGVMGRNFLLNMAEHGFSVAGYWGINFSSRGNTWGTSPSTVFQTSFKSTMS